MKRLLFILMSVAFIACQPKEESPLVKEALAVQDSARALHRQMSDEVLAMQQSLDDTMLLVRKLNDAEEMRMLRAQYADLESLNRKLKEWRENLIEIPGHCLHEDGEHHHHGNEHTDLTDQDILDVQNELFRQLQGLEKQFNTTKGN
ncbi:MAG: hypothetical protein NWQ53_12230 [Flavobacteriales bacterium]|jgi:hypothetical protein|nr:hypothetical protein [Flavobacteriales bacterium]MDP4954404.1 hypothetical protein [Flavobacteriales bacterium]